MDPGVNLPSVDLGEPDSDGAREVWLQQEADEEALLAARRVRLHRSQSNEASVAYNTLFTFLEALGSPGDTDPLRGLPRTVPQLREALVSKRLYEPTSTCLRELLQGEGEDPSPGEPTTVVNRAP